MDVFIVVGGVIQNIASVESLEWAINAYPNATVIARTEENKDLQIGDAI